VEIGRAEAGKIKKLTSMFTGEYRRTVEALVDDINAISAFVPERRERKLHTGMFGYARSLGKKRLPRAIKFTGALYSLGVPPEFIGTGRGILEARKAGLLEALESNYANLRLDLQTAGRYLNKENLKALSERNSAYAKIALDVELCEDYLGTELGPSTSDDFLHRNLTSNILLMFLEGKDVSEDVVRAGEVRRSLG
jgi:phosphoenolpyruvate carboxylase